MRTMTPTFRVSFPSVTKPRFNQLSKKEEYSLQALFKKGEDLSKLEKLADDACIEKWGADKKKWPKNLRTPFKDQGERTKDGNILPGYEDGAIYLNLKSTRKPGLVDQNVEPIIDDSEFYAGCYARATVSAYAYDQAGNRGVNFGLQNIQKVKDGEALGGVVPAENDFEALDSDDPDDIMG